MIYFTTFAWFFNFLRENIWITYEAAINLDGKELNALQKWKIEFT